MTETHPFQKIIRKYLSTQKQKRWFAVILAGLLILLIVKGCSHNEVIKHSYHIAYDADWEHINLMGKERLISALSIDIMTSIAKSEHVRINLLKISDSNLYDGLDEGDYEGILTSLRPTMLNQDKMVFSDPYFLLGPVLVMRTAAPVKGWNELSRKIVGVQSTSPAILELEKDTSIQIKPYDNILTALSDLDNNFIDGALFPAMQAFSYTTTFYNGRLKIATVPLNDDGLRLVTLNTPEGKELIQKFNEGLNTIKIDGTYNKFMSNWGLIDMEKINETHPPTPDKGIGELTWLDE